MLRSVYKLYDSLFFIYNYFNFLVTIFYGYGVNNTLRSKNNNDRMETIRFLKDQGYMCYC